MGTDNFRIKQGNYLANHDYHDWLLFWKELGGALNATGVVHRSATIGAITRE